MLGYVSIVVGFVTTLVLDHSDALNVLYTIFCMPAVEFWDHATQITPVLEPEIDGFWLTVFEAVVSCASGLQPLFLLNVR
jgi:hypothetical protein